MSKLILKYNSLYADVPPLKLVLDLQRFAAEDEGRTEEPTEKKIREAREKGQVAKTQELPQALVVIFAFGVIFMLGTWILGSIMAIMKYYLSSFSRMSITEKSLFRDVLFLSWETGKILMPVFAIACVAAVLGNVVQVGWQVSTHPLKLDWSKIRFDPATMFRKIFFSRQVFMNLVKSLFKVGVIGFVAYLIISGDMDKIMALPDMSTVKAFKTVMMISLKIIMWSSILLLVMAIPDYFFQKQEFMESLKMSKQEMKEELKETMGDPYVRARLREMQRDIAMKNMIRELPKADVVITNPTHFAVALKYDRVTMDAPTVIAKGVDSMALRIREIARENNVPMIENRPLAQQLYRDVEVGSTIPGELYYAVSLIYAELYKKKQVSKAI